MSSPTVTSQPNLIIGCGYLGRRVASRWLAQGKRVAALTRRNAETLSTQGFEPLTGDILDSNSLKNLPDAETVLYAIGRDRSSGNGMREVYVTGLGNVLNTLPKSSRFIYISSTGVFGQSHDELVDETSVTEPIDEAGRIVLEAEQLLLSHRPDAIILRFSGIYGPGRLLRQHALLKGEPLVADANRWLNLIHVDDGVEAVIAAQVRGVPGEKYLIADDLPVTRQSFYTQLANLLQAPPARFEQRPEPDMPHRRVNNAKAKRMLGWQLRYPSYREGLPAAVTETLNPTGFAQSSGAGRPNRPTT